MDIYVGNIYRGVEPHQLEELFSSFGQVDRTIIIRDKETRVSKGFGFISMSNSIEAQRAIDNLHNTEFMGRKLVVYESVPKEEREKQEEVVKTPSEDGDTIRVSFSNASKIKGNNHQKTRQHIVDNSELDEEPDFSDVEKSSFSKTKSDDGFVKISFKKE